MTREDNKELNKTITYEYDLGGNITAKKEYTYTTGTLGATPTKTINYTYGNTNWKDQLTSYDGKNITYDAIGNPISYDGNTYVWANGRQLEAITQDKTTQNLKETFDSNKILSTLSGDFNNDGKADIAVVYHFANNHVKLIVWLGTGTSFSDGQVWYDSGANGLNVSLIADRIVSGDFNGDGKADIGILEDCGNDQTKIYVFVSNGTAFTKQLWNDSGVGNVSASRLTGRMVAGDFDGDKKCDIAVLYDYGNADTGVYVWKSTGTQFNAGTLWDRSGVGNVEAGRLTGRVVAGDFDGDGKCDIAGLYEYLGLETGVLVWKSTGTKFNSAATWNKSAVGTVNAICFTGRVIAGDFNGDGKCDIIGMYLYPEGNLRTLIWKSQTTSFTNSQEIYNIGTTFKESQLTGRITCADFNKDGKSDIGLVTTDTTTKGAAYVFTSTGTVCNAPTKWWDTKNATSYKYNANGIRTQKTVNGVVTDYYLEGNNVIYEKTGSSIIYYTYDSAGRVVGINDNGTQYYYIRNAQEDIIGILNSSFGVVAEYRYDSWGKIVSICDNAGNDISGNIGHIANKNPYRYRGYRYDTETGLYYLQSRYYNPEWGRFINADGTLRALGSGILAHNMYLYCANSPITLCDPTGKDAVAAQLYLQRNPFPVGPGMNVQIERWKAGLDAAYATPGSTSSVSVSKVGSNNVALANNNKLPLKGKPNSSTKTPDGSIKRDYGPDGRAKKDTHWGHSHHHPNLDSPHEHDWVWDGNHGYPGEAHNFADIGTEVGIGIGVGIGGYALYRGIRMIPSLLPPLWPTIPVNLAIP